MTWIPRFALLGVILLVAGCGAERRGDAPVSIESATATPEASATSTAGLESTPSEPTFTATPTPTASPTATPTADGDLAVRFPAAAALIDAAPIRVGAALLTADGMQYTAGDDGTFALASVVKLPVMIATIERARLEARPLTANERELMRLMISVSSNSATDALWKSLGGGEGMVRLLEPLGAPAIEYAPDHQWGDSRARAEDIAGMLALLTNAESPLPEDDRNEALALLSEVVADQRWGAAAGVDVSVGSDASLAIKNGWYPEPTGWLLNTAGVITVSDGAGPEESHIVVVLTEGAETQTDGVRVIEEIAAAINQGIVPLALLVAPNPPTFAASTLPEEEPTAEPTVAPTAAPTAVSTPPALTLVPYGQSADVLVPRGASLVGSEGTASELTLWYELPVAAADEMLQVYGDSMSALGWLQIAGPPSVVLSKGSEARWVGLASYPAGTGVRVVEVTISPAPGVVPAGVD